MFLEQAFTNARNHLKTARQRAVFIFTPTNTDTRSQLLTQLHQLIPDAVCFSDTPANGKTMHRYRDALGQTSRDVILDYQNLIHADALAALTGTVSGGGCLWVILPSQSSPFQDRLLASVARSELIRHINSWSDLTTHLSAIKELNLALSPPPEFPSKEQQSVIHAMCHTSTTTHLLLADRGRGKSTTMALAIKAAGYNSQRPILVTASQPQAAATLLEHSEGGATFRAWDRLLKDAESYGSTLVIDEAAAIPLHILKELMSHYRVWAIATTVDGYEGCGKGFALRFLSWLQQSTTVQQHTLTEPLRWSATDTVEPWLNNLLMLTETQLPQPPQSLPVLRWNFVHASELSDHALQQVMTLLLEAHYQSSPNDLRLLLDDPRQQLALLYANEQIVSVCWLAYEGPIDSSLSPLILRGQRRLKGQLLPQAIGFYRQQSTCLDWRWLRIVRIASHPQLLRQGIASIMISKLIAEASERGIDAVGTSFGVTEEVAAFWRTTPFVEIRRGQKKNMASGEVSAIWAMGLSQMSQRLITQLQQLHAVELAWQQQRAFSTDLSIEATVLPILRGFAAGHLPLSNVRFAWWYLLRQYGPQKLFDSQPEGLFDPAFEVADLVQLNHFASRSEFEQMLRKNIADYLREQSFPG
ncbi:GNAT family N-acetyltransferase [Pseudidiomarina halophila]|uniref:N-acetyltransferase domain-containing protein n=1 Tax=Pseudidiomarina halophila TaxID=1449799 RepID=A0A432Y1U7_9GAMM|nr:GNAT family N-acetyltransferase [Pseudidiomarina halophila]RUO54933.1 hypothetical protein CWI69_05950 [Pseudidiomarina halophila]